MSNFIVAGITQIETIVKVSHLPIEYIPLQSHPDSILTAAGGDAYNEALALRWLGDNSQFLSVVGKNQNLGIFNPPGSEISLETTHILPIMEETPMEVILYQDSEHRQIFEDLKDIREVEYDMDKADDLIKDCDMVVLANANFCRPFVDTAKKYNKPIAVRVHNYDSTKEKHNADFLEGASILFFSGEHVVGDPYEFMKRISSTYKPDIILFGQDMKGVILHDRSQEIYVHYTPPKTLEVVNTTGAGNALFSAFLHYYLETKDATFSARNALLFMSYKVGFTGTSNGFLTVAELERWRDLIWK